MEKVGITASYLPVFKKRIEEIQEGKLYAEGH